MSDKNRKKTVAPEAEVEVAETAAAETAAAEAGIAEALKAELEKALADAAQARAEADAAAEVADKVRADAAEIKDSLLRISAEYDNYRKRTAKEKEAVYNDAYAAAVSAFLPFIDNLERAMLYPDGDGLKSGLELVMKQLSGILAAEKIEVIDPALKEFDPELHNAVMHIDDDSFDDNIVTEVLLKGYKLKDKVIRHAMVKVAN
ncbi:MAG: nucleotide exchange factor GrpE [Clostridia bacterium]|nr:nucleotide exchange factor GrpE [Clostridia bacterium]